MGSNLFSDLYGDLYGMNRRSDRDAAGSAPRRGTSSVKSSVDAMENARRALQEMEEKLQGGYLDRLQSLQPYPHEDTREAVSDRTGTTDRADADRGEGAETVRPGGTADGGETAERTRQIAAAVREEKPAEPETDPMEDLRELIGLTGIKHDVKELYDFTKIQKLRREAGMKTVPVSMHLVFTGNPGTGKTTVARILARLYRQIGVLSGGQLVECDRSGLVAGYVGQTAVKTQKKIEEAMGGVLFIDEAYSLARNSDNGTDFGQEAIDTLLKAMEDHREDFVVIAAGYTGPMENFIQSNPGLKSRFNKFIEFPDYTVDELMQIFDLNCTKYQYSPDPEAREQVRTLIMLQKSGTPENFANARAVRNLFETIITNQARRIALLEKPTVEQMQQITLEDLRDEEDAPEELPGEKAAKDDAGPEQPENVETAEDATVVSPAGTVKR